MVGYKDTETEEFIPMQFETLDQAVAVAKTLVKNTSTVWVMLHDGVTPDGHCVEFLKDWSWCNTTTLINRIHCLEELNPRNHFEKRELESVRSTLEDRALPFGVTSLHGRYYYAQCPAPPDLPT